MFSQKKNGQGAMRTIKIFGLLSLCCFANLWAAIVPETEGMESVSRGDGTFLTASPTYVWSRPAGSDGIHSSGELWSPEKLRYRLFLNDFFVTPSWMPLQAGIWLSTGNEIGDMIYQDLYVKKNETNKTPLLEGGFRSPSFHGFWVTARLFQVDHYSTATMKEREKWVGRTDYAWFGENLPFFSTAYAGVGYTAGNWNASVLVGKEYAWLYGESGRWIPVTYSPRVEGHFDYRALSGTFTFENAEFENVSQKESGARREFSGSLLYDCGKSCKTPLLGGFLRSGAGFAFRATRSEDVTYFELEDDFVAWPFLELELVPDNHFALALNAGANDKDWLVQDSLEYHFSPVETELVVGIGNRLGSRYNPLGDTYEFFDQDTIRLAPASGFFQIHRAYLELEQNVSGFLLGGRLTGWVEKGAETFETDSSRSELKKSYRVGDVSRIDSWISAVSGEVRIGFKYGSLFDVEGRGGIERIRGSEKRFEVNPAEGWVAFQANWNFFNYLKISQSWNYRSDARWNLRSENPLIVKGAWFWNLTLSQNFPEHGILLSGTLLHILGKEQLEVPNGGLDRTRFYCNIRKNF